LAKYPTNCLRPKSRLKQPPRQRDRQDIVLVVQPWSAFARLDADRRLDAVSWALDKLYDATTRPGLKDETEYTGFVDFDGFVFMCGLFTRNDLTEKSLGKLRFVMRKVLPIHVN
jgi:hypothetical protein